MANHLLNLFGCVIQMMEESEKKFSLDSTPIAKRGVDTRKSGVTLFINQSYTDIITII